MKRKIFLVGLILTLLVAPMNAFAATGAVVTMLADISDATTDTDTDIDDETQDDGPIIFITTARLNLRPTPSTSGNRLALVPAGHRVEVTDFRDGTWFAVVYDGIAGYMYAEFLREPSPPAAVGAVELLDWRYARHLMTPGTIVTLVDVRTGLSWQVAAFSNGNHSDIETITAEDTATKLRAFGGSWTWTPRPVLVLVDGRTIAASVNGMPHAGWTRSGNNMNGHVCLHFLGSRTHNGTVSHERDHQNAVMEAYRTASALAAAAPAYELAV